MAKVNAAGTALIFCGYVGGQGGETGSGIALDAAGNVYITGQTNSSEASFPVQVGPDLVQGIETGEAFVAKVAPALMMGRWSCGTGTSAQRRS